jgi:hypothetical protein
MNRRLFALSVIGISLGILGKSGVVWGQVEESSE